jgi:aminoglycoside 6'-N-acetyltransferase
MLWRWRMQPHVREFYQRSEISLDELAAKLGPRVRGEVPTICHVALHEGEPFAYLQCYRNADWPQHAALSGAHDGTSVDLHIGNAAYLHRGFGRAMLRAYLRDVVIAAFADEPAAYIAHDVNNRAAVRCSRAVGFQPLRDFDEHGVTMSLLVLTRDAIAGMG